MAKKKKVNIIHQKIDKVYKKIPDTKGCMDNLKECCGWCCSVNNPHVLKCEFERIFEFVMKTWTVGDLLELIEKALVNYLAGEVSKRCIFFDEKEKKCRIHDIRPFACRMYGITPEEEFKERYNKLVEKYKDNVLMILRPQCNLVSTIDNTKLTREDSDKLWNEMIKIEIADGTPAKQIVDKAGGTYLTYHDHLLITMIPDYLMENLSKVRQFGDDKDKRKLIGTILNLLESAFASEMDIIEEEEEEDQNG